MNKNPRVPSSNTKELRVKIQELTEVLMRERADSTNIRRQHEEQIKGLKDFVRSNTISELLPVIDNFERSLKHVPEDLKDNDYIKGIKGILNQFEKVLENLGVERIKTVGEIFDPRLHEAVSMEEGKGTHEVVVEELQPGYKLGDQVIRHAMVKVKMENIK